MSWEPIPDPDPRFRVIVIEGYPIRPGTSGSGSSYGVSATVLDSFYGTEHGRFASWDRWRGGEWREGRGGAARGRERALAAASERCAELNAWHEREGWGEDVPLAP